MGRERCPLASRLGESCERSVHVSINPVEALEGKVDDRIDGSSIDRTKRYRQDAAAGLTNGQWLSQLCTTQGIVRHARSTILILLSN